MFLSRNYRIFSIFQALQATEVPIIQHIVTLYSVHFNELGVTAL